MEEDADEGEDYDTGDAGSGGGDQASQCKKWVCRDAEDMWERAKGDIRRAGLRASGICEKWMHRLNAWRL